MNIEDSEKYELDIGRTLWSNLTGYLLLILIFVFVWKSADIVTQFDSQDTRLVGIIVLMFATLRLVSLLIDQISNLEYRPRKK